MAGRAVRRPGVVPVLSVATVSDPATQRALEQGQDAVQDTQTAIRALRLQLSGVAGLLTTRQVITASGVYVPSVGTVRAMVRMVGGGGGGGGALSTVNSSVGGGGASGVAIEFTLGPDATDLGPLGAGTVTIGAAGAAGTAAPGAGGTGGDTTLVIGPTTYTAKGGLGGAAGSMSGVGTAAGGFTVTGSTAGVPQAGDPGSSGLLVDASGNGLRGIGGSNPFGRTVQATTVGVAPLQAAGFGAGGSGGVVTGAASSAGGQGAPGLVIVEEFS